MCGFCDGSLFCVVTLSVFSRLSFISSVVSCLIALLYSCCICLCLMSLPRCVMGWSDVCDSGISWPKVIKLEFILKQNKVLWLAACRYMSTRSQLLYFILSLRLYSSSITYGPGHTHILFINTLSVKF